MHTAPPPYRRQPPQLLKVSQCGEVSPLWRQPPPRAIPSLPLSLLAAVCTAAAAIVLARAAFAAPAAASPAYSCRCAADKAANVTAIRCSRQQQPLKHGMLRVRVKGRLLPPHEQLLRCCSRAHPVYQVGLVLAHGCRVSQHAEAVATQHVLVWCCHVERLLHEEACRQGCRCGAHGW